MRRKSLEACFAGNLVFYGLLDSEYCTSSCLYTLKIKKPVMSTGFACYLLLHLTCLPKGF